MAHFISEPELQIRIETVTAKILGRPARHHRADKAYRYFRHKLERTGGIKADAQLALAGGKHGPLSTVRLMRQHFQTEADHQDAQTWAWRTIHLQRISDDPDAVSFLGSEYPDGQGGTPLGEAWAPFLRQCQEWDTPPENFLRREGYRLCSTFADNAKTGAELIEAGEGLPEDLSGLVPDRMYHAVNPARLEAIFVDAIGAYRYQIERESEAGATGYDRYRDHARRRQEFIIGTALRWLFRAECCVEYIGGWVLAKEHGA